VVVVEPGSRRVDARRNRARLIEAARELLAAEGVDVPVREIACRAGVGIGTLYRHFPTRDDLVDAVLEDAFEQYVTLAQEALREENGWLGLTQFVERALVLHAENRGLKDFVETRARGRERATSMRRRVAPLVERLIGRAQAEGTLRGDFAPQDLALVFWGADRVLELAGDVAPEVWRRQLGFVFDGLRSSAATPLAQPPLTERQERSIGARPARTGRRS
jgi:AcrR family transcriptional regulator